MGDDDLKPTVPETPTLSEAYTEGMEVEVAVRSTAGVEGVEMIEGLLYVWRPATVLLKSVWEPDNPNEVHVMVRGSGPAVVTNPTRIRPKHVGGAGGGLGIGGTVTLADVAATPTAQTEPPPEEPRANLEPVAPAAPEVPEVPAEGRGHDGKTLPQTVDASAWARQFCVMYESNDHGGITEDLMLTWFSNAIMAGHDAATHKAAETNAYDAAQIKAMLAPMKRLPYADVDPYTEYVERRRPLAQIITQALSRADNEGYKRGKEYNVERGTAELRRENAALNAKVLDLTAELEAAKRREANNTEELKRAQAQAQRSDEGQKKAVTELTQARFEVDSLRTEIEEKRVAVEELTAKVAELTDRLLPPENTLTCAAAGGPKEDDGVVIIVGDTQVTVRRHSP